MTDDTPTGFVMDRELQHDLLVRMRDVYPQKILGFPNDETPLSEAAFKSILYLRDHGLIEARLDQAMDDTFIWIGAKITVRGIDFLADDGGLTAILGVVTVKLHADTVRGLLTAKIDASDLPAEKRSAIKEAIGKLPGTALTAATGDLAKMGLEHAPGAVHWIERLVGIIT